MPKSNETMNDELFYLLRSRGYSPTPKSSDSKDIPMPSDADVFQFMFTKNGKEYGTVTVSIDGLKKLVIYSGDDVASSPSTQSGPDDIAWFTLLNKLKKFAQSHQLSFDVRNIQHLQHDMARRTHMKKIDENKDTGLAESYYATGRKSSYSDNVPQVKMIIQHSRALEEGERRYRAIEKIFVENMQGERFAVPTNKPGLARVYARHIAEGGTPYDDQGKHITSLCEEYTKMAGFVRATRSGQFNESTQQLVTEGINHYQKLRETLSRMSGHRGYHAYFESWTPTLTENAEETVDLSEMFASTALDPRIESVMPILSKLHKHISEMSEVTELDEWASNIIEDGLAAVNPEGIPENVEHATQKWTVSYWVEPKSHGDAPSKEYEESKTVSAASKEEAIAKVKDSVKRAYDFKATSATTNESDMASLIKRNMDRRASRGLADVPVGPGKVEKDIDAIAKDDAAGSRHQKNSTVHKHGLGKMKNEMEENTYSPPKLGTVKANLMNTEKPTVQVQVFKHNSLRGDSYWVTKEARTFKTREQAQAYVDRVNGKGVNEAAKWRRDDLEGKTWTEPHGPHGGKVSMGGNGPGDELELRPGAWAPNSNYKRMTKKGKPTQAELHFQDTLKKGIKAKSKDGGLAGPKEPLPEGAAPWASNWKKAALASKKAQQSPSKATHAMAARLHRAGASDPWGPYKDKHVEAATKHEKAMKMYESSVTEVTGDKSFDDMMTGITSKAQGSNKFGDMMARITDKAQLGNPTDIRPTAKTVSTDENGNKVVIKTLPDGGEVELTYAPNGTLLSRVMVDVEDDEYDSTGDDFDLDEARLPQIAPRGADYSNYDTEHLKSMLRPGVMHRDELKFKTLIRRELRKREAATNTHEVDEGRWIKGAGGVPLDRQGNPIPPKVTPPKAPAGPRIPRDRNGLTKDDYNTIWRKVEDVVGNIYPDGDPIDWMAPWLKRQGIEGFLVGEILRKAAKLNGYADMYAYYDSFKTDDYGMNEGFVDAVKKIGTRLAKPVEDPTLTQANDEADADYKKEIAAQNKKYAPKKLSADEQLSNHARSLLYKLKEGDSTKGSAAYRASLLRKQQERKAAKEKTPAKEPVVNEVIIPTAHVPHQIKLQKQGQTSAPSLQSSPFEMGQMLKKSGKSYTNPYKFDPKGDYVSNQDHNSFKRGYGEQITELSDAKYKEHNTAVKTAVPKNMRQAGNQFRAKEYATDKLRSRELEKTMKAKGDPRVQESIDDLAHIIKLSKG